MYLYKKTSRINKQIKMDRLLENIVKTTDKEILKLCNSLPDIFCSLEKKVVQFILSLISSTNSCKNVFSTINATKSKQINTLTNIAACIFFD